MNKTTWRFIRDQIVEHLKGKAIKLALKKVLGSVMAGGIKGWLVKFVVTELFEEIAEPLIKLAIRKGFVLYDKIEGSINVKQTEKAKDEGNYDDYLDHVGKL